MIVYRPALPSDGPDLARMGARSFTETFGTLYRPADLAAFLEETFGDAGLPSQLSDPRYAVQLATEQGQIIGFAKIGPVLFPGDWGERTLELHQLYVLGGWHGQGISHRLIDWAHDAARARGADRMVLSVFVDNHRAKAFYARHGYREVGRYAFRVGSQIDDDRIWSRAL